MGGRCRGLGPGLRESCSPAAVGSDLLPADGDRVFETYWTTGRAAERMSDYALLDMTVYGRQETWEDSPAGWPRAFATTGDSSARMAALRRNGLGWPADTRTIWAPQPPAHSTQRVGYPHPCPRALVAEGDSFGAV